MVKVIHGIEFPTQMWINGEWRDAENNATFEVINPANGELLFNCANGSKNDVDVAAKGAHACYLSGVLADANKRGDWLEAIASALEAAKPRFALMETINMGKPYKESEADVDDAVTLARLYATIARKTTHQPVAVPVSEPDFKVSIAYVPIGPCAGISPWNFPLLMTVQKVFAAIAAGCPLVLKPSELAPATSLELAKLCSEAGLPNGVFNVVSGLGDPTGSAVASHPLLVKTAFTGSVATGKKVMANAASKPFPTPVTLELGGKSPIIVCEDIPDDKLDAVADWAAIGIFFNSGQVCSATSRLIVHKNVAQKLVSRLTHIATERIRVCDPVEFKDDSSRPQMGPIVSKAQKAKVVAYIQQAIDDGGQVVCGGVEAPAGVNPNGFYVQPTIIKNLPATARTAREEVFGPVLTVFEFDNDADAIAAANDTDYGLAAAVMTNDQARLGRIANALHAGTVFTNVNQRAFVQAPWGGFKASGFGRELGEEGVREFLNAKTFTGADLGFTYKWYLN